MMLSLLNVKGRVSTEVGSDSYTQLHSAQQTLGASSAPGLVPGGHEKYLDDLSSSEGAGEAHTARKAALLRCSARNSANEQHKGDVLSRELQNLGGNDWINKLSFWKQQKDRNMTIIRGVHDLPDTNHITPKQFLSIKR